MHIIEPPHDKTNTVAVRPTKSNLSRGDSIVFAVYVSLNTSDTSQLYGHSYSLYEEFTTVKPV